MIDKLNMDENIKYRNMANLTGYFKKDNVLILWMRGIRRLGKFICQGDDIS